MARAANREAIAHLEQDRWDKHVPKAGAILVLYPAPI